MLHIRILSRCFPAGLYTRFSHHFRIEPFGSAICTAATGTAANTRVFVAAESITICIAQLFLNVATAFAAESTRRSKVLRSRFLFGLQNNSPAEAGPLSSDV